MGDWLLHGGEVSTDIVERLRAGRDVIIGVTESGMIKGETLPPSVTELEAAETIASLRQEVETLRETLADVVRSRYLEDVDMKEVFPRVHALLPKGRP